MVVLNTSKEEKTIHFADYTERTNGFTTAKNILTSETLNTSSDLKIGTKQVVVMELGK